MHETAEELERTIAEKHGELGQNLSALDEKAHDLTDWRAQFEKRPLVVLGAAVAGGVVLAALLGGSRSGSRERGESTTDSPSMIPSPRRPDEGTWRRLRSAVGLVAAGAAMELVGTAVPGIKKRVIDPIREEMAKGSDRARMNRGDGVFPPAPSTHASGFHAPDVG